MRDAIDGLGGAFKDGSVVVDVSNSPSLGDAAVLDCLETSIAYFGDVEHSFRLMPNLPFESADLVLEAE